MTRKSTPPAKEITSTMRQQQLSFLPLQVLLHFNGYYTFLWLALNIVIFFYKANKLFYTVAALRWETSMLFLTYLIDFTRIKMATRGNKTENALPLIWSCGLSVAVAVAYSFFLNLQTYV
eukprot:scaffold26508_cov29-Cyclotella_meneghiniana.AAC.3